MGQISKIFANGTTYKLQKGDATEKGRRTKRRKNFQVLRELQAGGLVAVGGQDLDLAAAAKSADEVQLTPRGRQAARLADKKLI
jgi:hypothetical protein